MRAPGRLLPPRRAGGPRARRPCTWGWIPRSSSTRTGTAASPGASWTTSATAATWASRSSSGCTSPATLGRPGGEGPAVPAHAEVAARLSRRPVGGAEWAARGSELARRPLLVSGCRRNRLALEWARCTLARDAATKASPRLSPGSREPPRGCEKSYKRRSSPKAAEGERPARTGVIPYAGMASAHHRQCTTDLRVVLDVLFWILGCTMASGSTPEDQ